MVGENKIRRFRRKAPREYLGDYEELVDSLRKVANRIIDSPDRVEDRRLLYDIIYMGGLTQYLHLEVSTCEITNPRKMESEIREVMSRVSDVLEIAESRELDVRMFRRTHKERTNCMIKALREYNGLFRFFSEIDRPPIRKTV